MTSDTEHSTANTTHRFRAIGFEGWMLIIVALVTIVVVTASAARRDMTGLETVLWSILIAVFSVIASALVSSRISRNESRQTYEQLARPALRRVLELDQSLSHLRQYLAKKRSMVDEDEKEAKVPEVSNWLEAIDALLVQHTGQLRAGIDDWYELLPDDIQPVLLSRRITVLENQLEEERSRHEQELVEAKDQAEAGEAERTRHQERAEQLADEINRLKDDLREAKRRSTITLGEADRLSPGTRFEFSEPIRRGAEPSDWGDVRFLPSFVIYPDKKEDGPSLDS